MRMIVTFVHVLAVLLISPVVVKDAQSAATEAKSLPAFEVSGIDGLPVRTDQLPRAGRWLLLYVQTHCGPCEDLLFRLKKDRYSNMATRLVVVVGSNTQEVQGLAKKFPDLPDTVWYADPLRNTATQLQLRGAPVMLGMQQSTIEWMWAGLLPDAKQLDSLLARWLTE